MERYFKKDILSSVGYMICVPISCFASVLFALSIQPVIDSILSMNTATFQKSALAFAFWGLVDIGLLLLIELLTLRLLKNINIALKDDLCSSVLRMSYQEYVAKNSDALSILINDTEMISSCYFSSLLSLYRILWSFFFSIVTAIRLSPLITIVVLLVGVISVWIPRLMGGKIDALQLALSGQKESYNKTVKDMLDGIATIKTSRSEPFFAKRHHRSNLRTENLDYTVNCKLYLATWFSGLCSSVAYIATLILGGLLALRGHMTAGLGSAFRS